MLRRSLRLAGLVAALLAVAGCQITIVPAPLPTVSGVLTAQTTLNPTAQIAGALGAGEVRYYRVEVPNPGELLYVEAVGSGLQVSLRTSGNSLLGVSTSPRYFAYGTTFLAAGADVDDEGDEALEAASLVTAFVCQGPCVAIRSPGIASYLMRVENLSGSSRSFSLFAYTIPVNDTFEPNGSRASATVLPSTGNYRGAIEWLGDEDWFVYTGPSSADLFLVFTPFDFDLGLELEFVDCPTCEVLDGRSGSDVEGLLSGDVLRVRSAAGRAGPAGSSGYDIEIRIGLP